MYGGDCKSLFDNLDILYLIYSSPRPQTSTLINSTAENATQNNNN